MPARILRTISSSLSACLRMSLKSMLSIVSLRDESTPGGLGFFVVAAHAVAREQLFFLVGGQSLGMRGNRRGRAAVVVAAGLDAARGAWARHTHHGRKSNKSSDYDLFHLLREYRNLKRLRLSWTVRSIHRSYTRVACDSQLEHCRYDWRTAHFGGGVHAYRLHRSRPYGTRDGIPRSLAAATTCWSITAPPGNRRNFRRPERRSRRPIARSAGIATSSSRWSPTTRRSRR